MRRFIRWALMAASVAALGCGVAVPLATASAAAAPACTTTVNWIGLPGDGYAGGQVVQLEFSNTGKVTCTLYGHPGVAQMNAGRQVAAGHLDRHPGNRHAEARDDRARGAERPQRRGALRQAVDLDVPERHRPGPADRVSGPVPVSRLSRQVGDAGGRRAVHTSLTAFGTGGPAPALVLPRAGRTPALPRAPIARLSSESGTASRQLPAAHRHVATCVRACSAGLSRRLRAALA